MGKIVIREECSMTVPCDELRDVTKAITDVRLELKGVVTEMRDIAVINRRLDNQDNRIEGLEKLAAQLTEVAKSSHKRMDSMEVGQRWLIGITISLVLGVATLFTKFI